MNSHKHARLTPKGRALLVSRVLDEGWTVADVSMAAGVSIRHIKTRPYTPKTNGKAERFVQTSLREWAYARPYVSSAQREEALQPFLHRYNWHRPHCALNRQPPMSRIPAVSNLLEHDT
jgi:transposase InsO family protein